MRDMNQADLTFYRGYDSEFILKKAMALKAIYMHPARFTEFTKSVNCDMEAEEPGFRGALVTELHCAAFHQIEGMLSLLLAEYQDRPDWVYLTSYGNSDMKKAAKLIAAGDYGGITNQIHKALQSLSQQLCMQAGDLATERRIWTGKRL